ncbi:hypothetical protein RJ639_012771 [Escallonia herrerae]|uniref:Uncharacterized protein n=1 Tax=Escallonia herrerae TaxID=1293975 RepID=A0AA89ARE0_9ASTE|nr:hypothetical protein RJ639_012771 [Escallonia herrerae]
MEVERNFCGAVALERMVCSLMKERGSRQSHSAGNDLLMFSYFKLDTYQTGQNKSLMSLSVGLEPADLDFGLIYKSDNRIGSPIDIEAEKRFPIGDLSRVTKPDAENDDASETKDDRDDEDEDSDDSDADDDADDFPGGGAGTKRECNGSQWCGLGVNSGVSVVGAQCGQRDTSSGYVVVVKMKQTLKQPFSPIRIRTLALNLVTGPEIKPALVQLQLQPIPLEHRPHIPEPAQAHQPTLSKPKLEAPRLGHAGPGHRRLDGLLVLLDAAHAVSNDGLGLEGEDGAGVEVVEAKAEGGAAGGELGGGAVEEDVLLDVGSDVVGGEQVGDFLVGGGVRQTELYLHLHLACVRIEKHCAKWEQAKYHNYPEMSSLIYSGGYRQKTWFSLREYANVPLEESIYLDRTTDVNSITRFLSYYAIFRAKTTTYNVKISMYLIH